MVSTQQKIFGHREQVSRILELAYRNGIWAFRSRRYGGWVLVDRRHRILSGTSGLSTWKALLLLRRVDCAAEAVSRAESH